MIGDAPGDYQAAEANRPLFFPINPGAEEASWRRLFEEGIDRFLARHVRRRLPGQAAGRVRHLSARAATVACGNANDDR